MYYSPPNEEPLTNQHLNDRFSSPFALLEVAIDLARRSLQNGELVQTDPDILNQAYQVLSYIDENYEESQPLL